MSRALRILVVLVVLATAGDGSGGEPSAGEVTRIVDGDTIHVRIDGRGETVRYIGVDTPESVKPGAPVECFAKRASAFNTRLLAGERVRLVLDDEARDRYGRLLAYVYRARDGLFVNAALVRRGRAYAFALVAQLERIQAQAIRRTRVRHRERAKKHGSLRFWLVLLTLIATAVIVTIAMFETLYYVMG